MDKDDKSIENKTAHIVLMWTLDRAYCIRTNSTVDSCGVTVVKNKLGQNN